jgi:hypothetical protein
VAKPGNYKAIVWIEDRKLGTFGRKIEANLPAVTPAP